MLTTASAIATFGIGVQPASAVVSGGPIILMGIDAEDGGLGAHGPVATYVAVANSILGQTTNGGTGMLVFGCTTSGSDHVSTFWQAVAAGTSQTLTCAEGASAIAAQPLAGFQMIAVASEVTETPGGGLTQAESDALGLRAADIASFVNGGGGLFGLASADLSNPYPYLGGVGAFTFARPPDYRDITPTAEGLAVGITNALDVCCWHDEYLTFPSFLLVLATSSNGNPAAIGGKQVIVVPPKQANLSIVKTGPALVTEGQTYSYTLTVSNAGPDAATGVTVTDPIPANTTFVSASADCSAASNIVTCTASTIAAAGSTAFTITVKAGAGAGPIVNIGTVKGTELDPDPTNNEAKVVTTLNHNPSCKSLSGGPDLWPPNHKLRTITLSGATDSDGDPLTWSVTAVTQDEPTNGLGDGDTAIDAVLGTGNTLQLRAERSGLGDGRVYRISVTVTDGRGGSCTGVATVGVPHDQSGPGSIAVDSGLIFNSLV